MMHLLFTPSQLQQSLNLIKIKREEDINSLEWTSKKDADLSQLTNSVADIKNKVVIIISGANIDAI